ncbi:hypothetical protein F2Q69_00014311 [Brassica cretica]|uniref:Uncharacterized protein n=1 Tax=Brassica cretica TaxID=69181 RepID=A0A8S9R988_BRACR|nr:hypothetical protein F2Q69_00014311 [Brassica cretica]
MDEPVNQMHLRMLVGSSVLGTELGVPSSGDLEHSLIGDPKAPLGQDPVPLVLIAWVPLKLELILNLGDDRLFREIILNFKFCGPRSAEMYDFLGKTFNGFPFFPYIFLRLLFPFSTFLALPYLQLRNRLTMSKRSASSTPLMINRAGSKRRVESPVSRSDSSPNPDTGSEYDLAAPLPYAYASPPPIGPASSVSADDLVEWRQKYSLSSSIILRVPAPEEQASSFIPGQIAIYEDFFDIRGVIPALIASLCDFFEISPSQLNPPSWRLLVAIQNLGDLENLSFGINEVLFSYHLAPLNENKGRLHLRPRSGLPIVEELPRGDRKGSAFSKKFLAKHSLKERSEVNERANPAQKPLADEQNHHAGQLAGEFGRHASRLARRARPDPGLSNLLRLPYLSYSCDIRPSGPYASRFVLIKVILEVL